MAAVRKPAERVDRHAPWHPPIYEDADALAIQALSRGMATAVQQKKALDWILNYACATYDMAYRPGGAEGERDTTLALGRAFVGQQIVKLIKIKVGQLKPREGQA